MVCLCVCVYVCVCVCVCECMSVCRAVSFHVFTKILEVDPSSKI